MSIIMELCVQYEVHILKSGSTQININIIWPDLNKKKVLIVT